MLREGDSQQLCFTFSTGNHPCLGQFVDFDVVGNLAAIDCFRIHASSLPKLLRIRVVSFCRPETGTALTLKLFSAIPNRDAYLSILLYRSLRFEQTK